MSLREVAWVSRFSSWSPSSSFLSPRLESLQKATHFFFFSSVHGPLPPSLRSGSNVLDGASGFPRLGPPGIPLFKTLIFCLFCNTFKIPLGAFLRVFSETTAPWRGPFCASAHRAHWDPCPPSPPRFFTLPSKSQGQFVTAFLFCLIEGLSFLLSPLSSKHPASFLPARIDFSPRRRRVPRAAPPWTCRRGAGAGSCIFLRGANCFSPHSIRFLAPFLSIYFLVQCGRRRGSFLDDNWCVFLRSPRMGSVYMSLSFF